MERLKAWQAWLRELKPQLSDHPLDALVGAFDVSESPTGTLIRYFALIWDALSSVEAISKERLKPRQAWLTELKPQLSDRLLDAL